MESALEVSREAQVSPGPAGRTWGQEVGRLEHVHLVALPADEVCVCARARVRVRVWLCVSVCVRIYIYIYIYI